LDADHHDAHGDSQTRETKKRLNVLVLYPDDWRHDSLSAAGTQIVQTPFLDQLAREGIRFTHNCVTTSVCWISRATLLTGQYFARHQSADIKNPRFYDYWNESSFPYQMQKEGYFVGHIGKWQYKNPDNWVEKHYNWTRLHEGQHWYALKNKTKIHATDLSLADAKDFLNERKDKPFALSVAFYPPKAVGQGDDQYQPKPSSMKMYENETVPEPFVNMNTSFARLPKFITERNSARIRWHHRYDTPEKYQRMMKNMYRLISEVDEACRQIYLELDRQGILNETVIIFTTDNGLFHAEHGLAGKWYPYQESIRVPLIIRDPRMPTDRIGTLDDSFTLNVDLAPTILGAAGLPKAPTMQGRDISDLYLRPDSEPWREEFFYQHPSKGPLVIPESSAVVRKDYKYMQFPEFDYEMLFHLATDPLEEHDLAQDNSYKPILDEMRQRHKELAYEASWLSYASSIDWLFSNVTIFSKIQNPREKRSFVDSLSKLQEDIQKLPVNTVTK
jgi:arylsulfatase A-like enzyme